MGKSGSDGTYAADIFSRVWTLYEEGALVVACAWCGRIQIDECWIAPPKRVLAAIDAPNVLSHSICDSCSQAAMDAVTSS